MFQSIVDNIIPITGFFVFLGGLVWGVWKYGKKNIKNEVKLENRVTNLEKDHKEDKENGDRHHKRLYDKLEAVSSDVAFIRGKLE